MQYLTYPFVTKPDIGACGFETWMSEGSFRSPESYQAKVAE